MKQKKIKVMISSRCNDIIKVGSDQISFTDLRKYCLEELENEAFLGEDIFDVTISENIIEPSGNTSWEKCLKEARDSDFVIVWLSGYEGYKAKGKTNGICQEEFLEAINSNPSKVFIIDFRKLEITDAKGTSFGDDIKRDSEFSKLILRRDDWLQIFNLEEAKNLSDLKTNTLVKCKEILLSGITEFVIKGSASMRQINHQFGGGLQWTKLNYRFRQEAIKYYTEKGVNKFLMEPDFNLLKNSCVIHALPDSMSVVEARELVGRPFLKDLDYMGKNKIGPIHIVGVYKTATEKQLRDLIGHQDVAIIQESFGFYVWDLINHIQLIYLVNCKDPEITSMKVDNFFQWLRIHEESPSIIDRARRRMEILRTINDQKIELRAELR